MSLLKNKIAVVTGGSSGIGAEWLVGCGVVRSVCCRSTG